MNPHFLSMSLSNSYSRHSEPYVITPPMLCMCDKIIVWCTLWLKTWIWSCRVIILPCYKMLLVPFWCYSGQHLLFQSYGHSCIAGFRLKIVLQGSWDDRRTWYNCLIDVLGSGSGPSPTVTPGFVIQLYFKVLRSLDDLLDFQGNFWRCKSSVKEKLLDLWSLFQ